MENGKFPMTVIFLSFLTCTVAVFSLWRAIYGEPAVHVVRAVPRPVLLEAVDMLDDGEMPDEGDDEVGGDGDTAGEVVRGFSTSLMSLMSLSLVEVGLAAYFLATIPELPAVWFLVVKSVVTLYWLVRQMFDSAGSVLRAVAELPDRVLRWKRVGDFIGALCFGVLFLIVNGLIPYGE